MEKGYNCPTSDRDGICVDSTVNRKTVMEIEATNGCLFLPDAVDRLAIAGRQEESPSDPFGWDMGENGERIDFDQDEEDD